MPNKKESYFKDFLQQLEAEKIERGKPVEQIEERKYFLIVCEGIRTEPIYFEYLKRLLPKHLLETVEISGEGDNTINVVNAAIEKRDKRVNDPLLPPYNEVWAVFDKDDFPNERYDNAVTKAQQFGIEPGVSNEAFELWYILHFQLLETALKRQQYFDILSDILGFKYAKNSQDVVQLLFEKGNIKRAIGWARHLEDMHAGLTPSESCPYTRVYLLVENLLTYSKHF
jgi:hypothetical protein